MDAQWVTRHLLPASRGSRSWRSTGRRCSRRRCSPNCYPPLATQDTGTQLVAAIHRATRTVPGADVIVAAVGAVLPAHVTLPI